MARPKGIPQTEEWKKRISEMHKKNGVGKWNKGKKYTEERKRKMSLAAKLVPHTEEWNKNVGLANKGKKHSPEFGERIRQRMLGKKPTNLAQLAEISRTRNSMKRPEVRIKLSGANNKWWKGGLTPIAKQIRECFEYNNWRKAIFQRDDYACVLCKIRGIKIVADHNPTPFSEIFYKYKIKSLQEARECNEFWDLQNGRTLCEDCHRKTDTWGFRILPRLRELKTPF
ncbi:MAG: NUMOD3 domain-containing DNA-binding protein [Nanoarchaeota archaeon]